MNEMTPEELLERDRQMAEDVAEGVSAAKRRFLLGLSPQVRSEVLRTVRMMRRFPDTASRNMLGRIAGLERRRTKNAIARASRKRNRP
jgi:hypothetical protein